MSNVIDIRSKITNELPIIQITDEVTIVVNNRQSVVMNIMALTQENDKKVKAGKEVDDKAFMDKALAMLIGEKNVKTIDELNLPMPEYQEVFQTIMSVATGTYGKDTPSK